MLATARELLTTSPLIAASAQWQGGEDKHVHPAVTPLSVSPRRNGAAVGLGSDGHVDKEEPKGKRAS